MYKRFLLIIIFGCNFISLFSHNEHSVLSDEHHHEEKHCEHFCEENVLSENSIHKTPSHNHCDKCCFCKTNEEKNIILVNAKPNLFKNNTPSIPCYSRITENLKMSLSWLSFTSSTSLDFFVNTVRLQI